jgi:ElaB/YqjD/DUF883 family membrane-anchored ribosome-binding protein
MARDPNATDLAADYDALLVQLTAMREEMSKLAAQVAASATQRGAAMADTVTHGMHDARAYAGRKTHQADVQIEQAVAANPYIALGLAAGLGLLLGAVTRR